MNCCKETRFLQSSVVFFPLPVMSLQNIHYSPFLQAEAVIFFISTHLLTIRSTFVSCFWLKRSNGQSHLLEDIFRDSTVCSFHPHGKIGKTRATWTLNHLERCQFRRSLVGSYGFSSAVLCSASIWCIGGWSERCAFQVNFLNLV